VDLRDPDNVKRTLRVARLVAWAWVGPQPEGYVVCHRDGDCDNNRVSNLYYGTHADNMLDLAYHQRNGIGTIRPKPDPDDGSTYMDESDLPDGILEAGYDAAVGF
jgi:hypothetical protein